MRVHNYMVIDKDTYEAVFDDRAKHFRLLASCHEIIVVDYQKETYTYAKNFEDSTKIGQSFPLSEIPQLVEMKDVA